MSPRHQDRAQSRRIGPKDVFSLSQLTSNLYEPVLRLSPRCTTTVQISEREVSIDPGRVWRNRMRSALTPRYVQTAYHLSNHRTPGHQESLSQRRSNLSTFIRLS